MGGIVLWLSIAAVVGGLHALASARAWLVRICGDGAGAGGPSQSRTP